MDVLLARILKFLNGALTYDDEYIFCTFLINHYLEIEDYTLDDVALKSHISKNSILNFLQKLGFHSYDEFHERMIQHQITRLDQIKARMLGVRSEDFVKDMEKECSDQEMLDYISQLCESIDKAQRVMIIGALYPMSIAVEFQTDLITFGKPVIQYHDFDNTLCFDENDLIIFISATGRAMKGFMDAKQDLNVAAATSVLITQNPIYTMEGHKVSNYVLKVPGKFDGINFNYQIMKIFDLLRIHYYQQYYIA